MISKKKKLPELNLIAVEFQREGTPPSESALPVMPDSAEWKQENRSLAVYSIEDVRGAATSGKLAIYARFRKSEPGGRVQIRAVDVQSEAGKPPRKLAQVPRSLADIPFFFRELVTGDAVHGFPGKQALGNVMPTTIYFSEDGYSIFRGSETFVPMKLEGAHLHELGVGIFDVDWKWEFRVLSDKTTEDEDVWEDTWHPVTAEKPFNFSKHRVFTLLGSPGFPWTQNCHPDFGSGPPFAVPLMPQALMIACAWAQGAVTREEAAKAITDRLYECGRFTYTLNSCYSQDSYMSVPFQYGQPSKGNLAFRTFHFSKVIERLLGGAGKGGFANCFDCALIVSTLANALGCRLYVGKMQATELIDTTDPDYAEKNKFEINTLCAIGHKDSAESMKGLLMGKEYAFSYHAVAWQSTRPEGEPVFPDETNLIYDACARFVSENNAKGGETLLSASGVPLGTEESEGGYRKMLGRDTALGVPRCFAQPATVTKVQIL